MCMLVSCTASCCVCVLETAGVLLSVFVLSVWGLASCAAPSSVCGDTVPGVCAVAGGVAVTVGNVGAGVYAGLGAVRAV